MSDEARRRVIRVALERRPDMGLEDLRRTLARVGIEVDTETLVADLDTIGHSLRIVPAGPAHQRVPSGAPVPDDADADGAAPRPAEPAGDGRSLLARLRPGPLLVAAVVAFVLVVAGILVLGDDDEPTADTGPIPTTIPVEEGSLPAETTAPLAPAEPADDPALTEPDVALTFDVDSAVLPPPSEDVPWTAFSGDFEVVDGQAVSTGPEAMAVATFPVPGSETRAQVTLPTGGVGVGLAFLTADGETYAWVVMPDDSTVVLHRLGGAEPEVMVDAPLPAISPGLRVGLSSVGPQVELLANGAVVATVDELGPVSAVGLAAIDGDVPGAFDDLVVQYP
ncbi:hypothetical protein HC251_20715 [Iamia sp. SCSIO 61187]|uniref:hypothetical protein n=1 Tax=Iamia sp. SCSIO 61187 TaxID=2722752 RepID=UPI001C6314CC|nr:hypothetical protein [Iamia sp. SCSIO 61187]QYG94621.1 hypothetical protein HC251_20715 [Iamia sp. SCSIO 61187]